jgi:hypothetical protein
MYVTLGLACACLGYAEQSFLPEMTVFAGVVGVLLIAAYQTEGRWALSIRAANYLGGAIAAAAAGWVAWQFFRPWGGTLLDQLPWPTSLLPYLGPLLMILIPAKLFRPKHNGDFWALQGIGLIAVALGCALAGDPPFGVLLFAYLVSVIWSLSLFYYFREQERAGVDGRRAAVPTRPLAQAGRWAAAVVVLAMVLFLATPRSGDARWDLALNGGRLQTGVDDNRPGIDLNRSGTLQVSRDLVFEVLATRPSDDPADAADKPKTDLDPGQRWRSTVFNYYESGRWEFRPHSEEMRFGMGSRRPEFGRGPFLPQRENAVLSRPGPQGYYLEYHPHTRNLHTRILAEPIVLFGRRGERLNTVVSITDEWNQPWVVSPEGELVPPPLSLGIHRVVYKQVVVSPAEPGVSPSIRADENFLEHYRNHQAVPRLRGWGRAVLQRLVDQGRLQAAALGRPGEDDRVPPEHYEAVARTLEAFLGQSGAFKYSLNLERRDAALDPVEDFVLNTRKGHCSRFATALALILRSQGVPTRIVLGFRGWESDGDGRYQVRQYHAHAWVEALIYRPPTRPDELPWRWLTLDPTPAGDEVEEGEFQWGQWWENTRQGVAAFFKNFVVEYDSDQQDRAKTALAALGQTGSWLSRAGNSLWAAVLGPGGDQWERAATIVLVGVAALAVAARVGRRWRAARRGAADPATAFYRRLLDLCAARLGATPRPGETPGEFAATTADCLRAAPATQAVADVPAETAVLFYRVRFGGRPLAADERRTVDARLDRLATALAPAQPGAG